MPHLHHSLSDIATCLLLYYTITNIVHAYTGRYVYPETEQFFGKYDKHEEIASMIIDMINSIVN